jgi:hypothetical protein
VVTKSTAVVAVVVVAKKLGYGEEREVGVVIRLETRSYSLGLDDQWYIQHYP